MAKFDQVDIYEAQQWFDNLKKQLGVSGAVYDGKDILITQQGLEDIATLLHVKKVGRWDDHMNELQIAALKAENNKMNDVASLITGWFERTVAASKFETPPTELELDQSMYQLVSQILKTLRVEMSAAKEDTGLEA